MFSAPRRSVGLVDCAENLSGLSQIPKPEINFSKTEVGGRGALCTAKKFDPRGRMERTQERMLAWVTCNLGEIPRGRKPKVSYSTIIEVGLGGPKLMVKTGSDGQTVNIPSLQHFAMEWRGKKGKACYWIHVCGKRCAAWQIRQRPVKVAPFSAGKLCFAKQTLPKSPPRKTSKHKCAESVPKPTQVGEARSLRPTSD